MTLSVLSLNLWHDAGPYPARRERIRESVQRLAPDVIGFQEALRGASWDQAGDLVGDLGYHVEFEPATAFWRDGAFAFGNAAASRWPIRERAAIRLPESGDGETRSALLVQIDAPFGALCFATTHLNWKLHHGAVRERQVVALCDFVLEHRPRGGFPPVFTGDLNAEPDSAEIRYVSGLQSLGGRSVHFRDAWRVAGGGGPGATWSNRNPYARQSHEPDRRIDYVFAGYPLADGRGRLEHCRVALDDERDGVWPSDHFGVYAELRS